MLANAATGPSKNIAPNRLIATSNVLRRNAWGCASACKKMTTSTSMARRRGDLDHRR